MSFKVHLLIIMCIIIAVVLSWIVMQNMPSKTADLAAAKPAYSIAINHASWGLNCRDTAIISDKTRDAFLNKTDPNEKLREDNVLGPVSRLCNGNADCDITPDENTLGTDPSPACGTKVLEVEYRCFSYDRPWNIKKLGGNVTIHCDQPQK